MDAAIGSKQWGYPESILSGPDTEQEGQKQSMMVWSGSQALEYPQH